MRHGNWITLALGAITLLIAIRFLGEFTDVQSGQRFQNRHAEIPCSDCHALIASSEGKSFGGQVFRKECERCHSPEVSNTTGIPLGFHEGREKGCPECHSFHDIENITAAGRAFRVSFENRNQRAQCYSCHRPFGQLAELSPGHRAAADMYHSDFRFLGKLTASETCLICHFQTAASGSDQLAEVARNAPQFDEHGSHPVGVAVAPGTGEPGNRICKEIDSRIQLFGGKIECPSCHSLTSRNRHRLVAFDSKTDLCRACHEVD